MPAVITISRAGGTGQTFPVEDPVFRVGSDAKNKLCLRDPAVPDHALTVEFRGGQYIVHNRMPSAIVLGGARVRPNGSGQWVAGQVLQLTPGLTLRLVVTGNPAPTRQAEGVDLGAIGSDNPLRETAEAVKRPSKIVPIVVLAVCGILAVAVLLLKPSDEDDPADDEFEKLVMELRACPPDRERRPAVLLELLQSGRAAQKAGHANAARTNYAQIITLLRKWQDELRSGASADPPGGEPGKTAPKFDPEGERSKLYGRVLDYARKRMKEREPDTP